MMVDMSRDSWSRADAPDAVDAIDVDALFRSDTRPLLAQIGAQAGADARDIVQDAFRRLLERGSETVVANPRAYLRTIVQNLLRDRAKLRARRHADAHAPIDDSIAIDEPDPHRLLHARDALRRVDAAIAAMPSRRRDIFLLHRVDALDYAQIASHMGVSVKSVEKHITLALRELRRAVGDAA